MLLNEVLKLMDVGTIERQNYNHKKVRNVPNQVLRGYQRSSLVGAYLQQYV